MCVWFVVWLFLSYVCVLGGYVLYVAFGFYVACE